MSRDTPHPLAASFLKECKRNQAMHIAQINRGLDDATFLRVLKLMRAGLKDQESTLRLLVQVGALETAAKLEIEVKADRLLVMGWICAAEALGIE